MNPTKKSQFEKDGFIIFKNVIDKDLISRLKTSTKDNLSEEPREHFEQEIATGSMIKIDWSFLNDNPIMSELVTHPGILLSLKSIGYTNPKFGHGRIISKPPHSPQLFWHEDGRYWDNPVSLTTLPVQCFLMVYLTDTNPTNGCLRVIPGSHTKRHHLHDVILDKRNDEQIKYQIPDDPSFGHADGEIDVPLQEGDCVFGYGTLLHASHPNNSEVRRTCLTMWYYPAYLDLPERTQATVARDEKSSNLLAINSAQVSQKMAPFEIRYQGNELPYEGSWTPSL